MASVSAKTVKKSERKLSMQIYVSQNPFIWRPVNLNQSHQQHVRLKFISLFFRTRTGSG